MRVRSCIRCELPLEERSVTIGEKTHRAWVRICHCQVAGRGWFWRIGNDPLPVIAPPAPPPVDPDDIPDSALDWTKPPVPATAGFGLFDSPEPLTHHYGASA